MKHPRSVFGLLKKMKSTDAFTFPDGSQLLGKDVMEEPIKGRKIVILGDTCNSSLIEPIAMDATILVHEATNAWDSSDRKKFPTYSHMEHDTFAHGHSTPQMAAKFAAKIRAKRLILTHFSPRYAGDDSESSMYIMWQLEDMAKLGSNHFWGRNDVIAAWDQMSISP
jgi:ribonuclease Z